MSANFLKSLGNKGFSRGEMLRADGAGFPPEFCDASISEFDFGIYGKDLQKLESIARSLVNDFENKWWNNGKGLFLCSRSPGAVNNERDCDKYFDCDLLILDDLGAEKFIPKELLNQCNKSSEM